MNWFFGFAVYFIIWWLTLFLILPFGFRSQQEEGQRVLGTVASAPAHHRAWRTFLLTTIVAAAIFAAGSWSRCISALPSIPFRSFTRITDRFERFIAAP